jgi:hypothetical protein
MQIIKPVTVADAATVCSRATANGTYFDKTGALQTAPANTLRLSYDPSDLGAAPRALIEPAATNLYSYSNTMGNAAWTLTEADIVGGLELGIDGAMSAFQLVDRATTARHELRTPSITLAAGTTYTTSVYAKAGSRRYLRHGFSNVFGNSAYCVFDLQTGAIVFQSVSDVTGKTVYVGGGWYRCIVTYTVKVTATGTNYAGLQTQPIEGNGYTGDGNGYLILSCAQLEIGTVATSPILTGNGVGTRAADIFDPATGAGLLCSNVIENDADDGPLWAAGSTYTTGQTVRRPNHRRYYALQAVPAGATPENNTAGATPYWQDIGPTKLWSVFDATYSTIASAADVVVYVLRPGQVCTGLAAVGLDASSIRVSMVDPTGVLVYDKVKSLRIKNSRSISDYLFGTIERRTDEVFDDLPPFKSGILTVTVAKLGSTPKVGDIQFGRLEGIGETQWKPEIRTLRRSKIDDDGFGNVTFIKRRSSKLLTVDVAVDNTLVDYVVRMLNGYTDTPCVIIGDSTWTSLIILGFVQDFRLVLEGPGGSLYNAQIQGFA